MRDTISKDTKSEMIRKFINFALLKLKESNNEMQQRLLNNSNLTKQEIILLANMSLISKKFVVDNLNKVYAGVVKLSNRYIVKALETNKILTRSDIDKIKANKKSGQKKRKNKKLQLPILTKIYRFFNINETTQAKITAVVETPFIILSEWILGIMQAFYRQRSVII